MFYWISFCLTLWQLHITSAAWSTLKPLIISAVKENPAEKIGKTKDLCDEKSDSAVMRKQHR